MALSDGRPWEGPRWSVSPHNYAAEIARPTHQPELHDVTLRDGEEAADVVYTTQDKVRIAEALALAGIKRYELFVTVPGWYEAVRQLMGRQLPMELYVTWHPGRTERVLELGVRHVMIWYRASDVFQKVVIGKPRQAILDEALAGVKRVRELGAEVVNFFMPESTRMELDQLRDTVLAAKQAGVDAVTLVDSLAITRPAALGFLVGKVKEWSGLPVDVHCHNDFGLATACVLAAYEAGATGLNCSVNALGYRAGNAALEEVAVALQVLYGVDPGIRLDRLPALSRVVAEATGIEPGYFKAVVGRGAFRYEQWGSTGKLEAAGLRPAAFAYEPELVGLSPHLHIGKWSDPAGVERRLRELGLDPTAEQVASVHDRATRTSVAKGRPLGDDELLELAQEVSS